jgi:UPF0755 protein
MRRLLGIAGVLLAGVAIVGGWVWESLYLPYQGFAAPGVYVDIPHGASRRTIAGLLASQGVVRNRWVFEALTRRRALRTLQAGEYFFDHPVTAFEVFESIAQGRVFVRELVIPEGYSMFDIADLVAREGFTSRDDFLAAARDPSPIRDLAPNAGSLEGFLFPATYGFPRHPTGQEMVEAMVKRFRQEWAGISAQASGPPEQSLEQTLTLASLVERETPKADERPLVAGVFTNRLRQGVPLQCDPTVVYALELAGQYSGTLEAREIPFDSPYNTYRHAGLPPGPIANPGEASLRAALSPATTDYLYFVANTEGGHFFSKTLAEHNRNVAKYRLLLAAERRNAAQPENAAQIRPEKNRPHSSP